MQVQKTFMQVRLKTFMHVQKTFMQVRLKTFVHVQWRHSVKTRLYKNPPPYFIVLASSVETKEVEVIEFHRIDIVL